MSTLTAREANAVRVPMLTAAGEEIGAWKVYFGQSDPKLGDTVLLKKRGERPVREYVVTAVIYSDCEPGKRKLEKLIVEAVQQ